MMEKIGSHSALTSHGREEIPAALQRILAAAQPGAVFGEPVTSGNYTVITAREVASGGGFGSGFGFGGPQRKPSAESATTESEPGEAVSGAGGGMGGGGGAMGRPVAVIVIGPDGVTVKPIVDATKIAIAVITTGVAAFAAFRRVRRMSKNA